ncbi:DUF1285 domain-containing protein [Aurantimonas endophytica]|uniref:DUF1285 domain-containing protein n=1 Tax=Aurantimonas endophytica TaxID=1522175 RepID=A0A7W6MP18_9HYPH|nr:DUF1285 domain-containing protein [Aurantimonas endophytica]MBB4002417.1 hypothetical protein [Aurantimonas endophytica]MCO6401962.1 DUF1285 domain-containing protein [Aurantimonas endophytica]
MENQASSSGGPSLKALVSRAERAGKGAPPVEIWNPPFCGDIDMVIRADGTWTYGGSPIGRKPLVRLFSTVLRKDADGRTYLVTPVEKLGITVEDAHFQAVEMSRDMQGGEPILTFRTEVGDVVICGPDRPLRFAGDTEDGAFRPYVTVRGRLEARLTRALAYDLADFVEDDGAGPFVRSGGARFAIGKGAA